MFLNLDGNPMSVVMRLNLFYKSNCCSPIPSCMERMKQNLQVLQTKYPVLAVKKSGIMNAVNGIFSKLAVLLVIKQCEIVMTLIKMLKGHAICNYTMEQSITGTPLPVYVLI